MKCRRFPFSTYVRVLLAVCVSTPQVYPYLYPCGLFISRSPSVSYAAACPLPSPLGHLFHLRPEERATAGRPTLGEGVGRGILALLALTHSPPYFGPRVLQQLDRNMGVESYRCSNSAACSLRACSAFPCLLFSGIFHYLGYQMKPLLSRVCISVVPLLRCYSQNTGLVRITWFEKPECRVWRESGKWFAPAMSSGNHRFEYEIGAK